MATPRAHDHDADGDPAVQGCVAVDEHGTRLGKGGGFADPTRTIEVTDAPRAAARIDWDALTGQKVAAIPPLARLCGSDDGGTRGASQ